MNKANANLVRNVSVTQNVAQTYTGSYSLRKEAAARPAPIPLESLTPQTTLKVLKQLESLQVEDLDLSSDDEIVVGPPSFDVNERIYSNLVSLDAIHIPTEVKRTRTTIITTKERQPSSNDFLTHAPLKQYIFCKMITPKFPERPNLKNNHSLHMLLNSWKND